MQPTVDLIIPARNEEANIPALLAALPRHLLRRIIVADNGSTDRTAALARAGGAIVVHEPQPGYGAACLRGLAYVEQTADAVPLPAVVAFLDADLADDPAQLPRLIEPITAGEADLVIGSRPRLAEPGALTATQRFGNRLAVRLMRLTTGRRYADLGPMRAIRWSSLQALGMADRTWGWTVEMQYKAATRGLRVMEVDVPYRRRRAGRSKISGTIAGSFKAGCKILITIGLLAMRERLTSTTRHASGTMRP